MTLNRIDHFVITTKNLCQCLHFYVDILGMEHKIQREENDQQMSKNALNAFEKTPFMSSQTPLKKFVIPSHAD